MATRKIAMKYDLYQLNNENSPAFGKWFPRAIRNSTLSLRGLADHIANHGSVYTQDVVYGVLTKFKTCLVELIEQGTAVKLDGLGTFYPTLEAAGADDAVGYNIAEKLEGVHIRFLPERAAEDDITSRTMKSKVSLEQRLIFDVHGVPKKVVDGQLVNYGDGNGD